MQSDFKLVWVVKNIGGIIEGVFGLKDVLEDTIWSP